MDSNHDDEKTQEYELSETSVAGSEEKSEKEVQKGHSKVLTDNEPAERPKKKVFKIMELDMGLQQPQGIVTKERYVQNLVILLKLLPTTIDHLSDALVLYSLLKRGLYIYFFVGLIIDLIPGPVAVYQFRLLGHSWKRCLSLVCHPLNAYLHVFLSMWHSQKSRDFSLNVIAYSNDCQGLLESPIQLIFTTTLICLDILPTPFEKARDTQEWIITNSFGAKANLSFIPTLSVVISFGTIIFNAVPANDVFKKELTTLRRTLTWLLYLATTILFRIQIWVLICSFFQIYSLFPAGVILIANFVIFMLHKDITPLDPILGSLYSLAFPCASLKSVVSAKGQDLDITKVQKLHNLLTIVSSVVLIVTFIVLIVLVRLNLLSYSPNILWRRDLMTAITVSTFLLALLSVGAIASAIHSKRITRTLHKSEEEDTPENSKPQMIISSILKVLVLALALIIFFVPLMIKRQEHHFYPKLSEICGAPVDFEFEAYTNRNDFEETEFIVQRCLDDVGKQFGFGCSKEFSILVDYAPASPLPDELLDTDLIMLKPGFGYNAEHQFEELQTVLKFCRKKRKVVCYYTKWVTYEVGPLNITTSLDLDIDTDICTHYVFNFGDMKYNGTVIHGPESRIWLNKVSQVRSKIRENGGQLIFGIGSGGIDSDDKAFSNLVHSQSVGFFINETMKFLLENQFQGLDIAWLMPHCWNHGKMLWEHECEEDGKTDPQRFSQFLREMNVMLKAANLSLSATIAPWPWRSRKAYELHELSQIVDFVHVKTVDLRGPWDGLTGFGNALTGPYTFNCFNIRCAIDELVSLGLQKTKIVLGLQLHSPMFYPINDTEQQNLQFVVPNGPDAKTTRFSDDNFQDGEIPYLTYDQVCPYLRSSSRFTVEKMGPKVSGNFAYSSKEWFSFENLQSIQEKVDYVDQFGLEGVFFWAANLPDGHLQCQCDKNSLIKKANEILIKDQRILESNPNCLLN